MSEHLTVTECGVVTESDTVPVTGGFMGLYVGADGAITISQDNGVSTVLFTGVKGGTMLPVSGTHVYDTGTDASLSLIWLRW